MSLITLLAILIIIWTISMIAFKVIVNDTIKNIVGTIMLISFIFTMFVLPAAVIRPLADVKYMFILLELLFI